MTDLLLWSLFWPFIIIVPLALMAMFKYFNPRSFEILMYFLHRLKSEQSARQYWEDLQYLKNQKENESANPSQTENPWTPELIQWGPGKCSGFYKNSYSMEINLWISFRFWHGMSSIDSFSGMKKSPTKLTREKSWFLIMPMIIVRVVKTVELHLTDRIVVEKFLYSLIPVLMRKFSFIIWMRQDGRDTDPTFLFIRRRNG